MATDLERLIIRLEANTTSLDREMKKARGDLDRRLTEMERRTERASKQIGASLSKLGGGVFLRGGSFLAGVAASALGLEGLIATVQKAVPELAKLGDTADRIGITAAELQQLRFAAGQAGGSIESVDSGLTRFAANLADAATGSGQLYKELKANNVAFKDGKGNLLPLIEVFNRYSDVVKNARNPQEALEFAIRGFGRAAGPELAGLLRQGQAGIKALGQGIKDAGGLVDDELIKKAQELDDDLAKLGITLKASIQSGVVASLGFLDELGAKAREVARAANVDMSDNAVATALNEFMGTRKSAGPVPRSTTTMVDPDRALGRRQPATTMVDPDRMLGRRTSILSPSGGGGKSAAEKEADAYERLIESTQRRIADLRIERETLGMTEGAAASYRMERELLASLDDSDIKKTPERVQQIRDLAAAMGEATAATEAAKDAQERLEEEQRRLLDGLEEFKSLAADTAKSLRDAFRDGKIEAQEFSDILDNILTRISDRAFENVLNMLLPTGRGATTPEGAAIGAIASFFGGARAFGGPISAGRPYLVGERGPEVVVPTRAGTVIPNNRINGMGSIDARTTIQVDARGAQMGVGQQIRLELQKFASDRDRTLTARLEEQRRRSP